MLQLKINNLEKNNADFQISVQNIQLKYLLLRTLANVLESKFKWALLDNYRYVRTITNCWLKPDFQYILVFRVFLYLYHSLVFGYLRRTFLAHLIKICRALFCVLNLEFQLVNRTMITLQKSVITSNNFVGLEPGFPQTIFRPGPCYPNPHPRAEMLLS